MPTEPAAFVGLDVHKDNISVAIAAAGRDGEVRSLGSIANTPEQIGKLVRRLAARHGGVEYVYEAGPCGYGVHRLITGLGATCRVAAPSRIPRQPGERIKNDTRDAAMLARLLRAGELSHVWVPDATHEAVRELVRARSVASHEVRRARQRIAGFLLRHGRSYGSKPWGHRHRVWLANQAFEHPASRIAFQGYLNAHERAEAWRAEVDGQIAELLPSWSLAPVVEALQALKGVARTIAVNLVAEVGDFGRFANPRQLMAFLGLVPGERSSGKRVRPGGITKTGNSPLRALLYEAAWCYRTPPRVGSWMWERLPDATGQAAKDVAWKAQLRLHKRYRALLARGKRSQVAVTAVARELLGFVWAIARDAQGVAAPASA